MDTEDLSRRDIVRISGATAIAATAGVNSVSAQQSSTKNPTVYTSAQDQLTGWAVYAVDASTGQQDWIFTEPKSTTTSPVVVNGSLYFGTSDGNLFSLNASSGEKQWSFTEAAGGIVSSPTVTNGTAYFCSKDGSLYAVDAASGAIEWSITDLGGSLSESPTVTDGTVFFKSNDTVEAVNATTGEQEWSFSDSQTISLPLVVSNEHVYIISRSIYALDIESGEVDWVFYTVERTTDEIKRKLEFFPGGFLTPAVANNGAIYAIGEDRGTSYLFSVDANTGEQNWSKEFDQYFGPQHQSPFTVVNETIYLHTGSTLNAIEADSGETNWSIKIGGKVQKTLISDGTAYLTSIGGRDSKGALYAVDTSSAEQEWTFTTQRGGIEHARVVDGTVYTTSADPGLHAINAASGTEKWVFDLMDQNPVLRPTVADTAQAANTEGDSNTEDSSPGFGFVGGMTSLFAASYLIKNN